MSRLKIEVKQKTSMRQIVVRSASLLAILLAIGFTIYFLTDKENAIAGPGNSSANIDSDGDGIKDKNDFDDDNDGIPDSLETIYRVKQFINGGFEEGPYPSSYGIYNQNLIKGWTSTAGGNVIEIWKDGFSGVSAPHGQYFCELNSTSAGMIYQDIVVQSGDHIEYSFYHRGRAGKDEMEIHLGPTNKLKKHHKAKTNNTAWKFYRKKYKVPNNTTVLRVAFVAKKTHGNNNSVGNFLDEVKIRIIETEDIDFDGDGIPNRLDLDSDNDGIYDVIEAGGTDPDGDGIIGTGSISDSDNDGWDNSVDPDNSGTPLAVYDSDNDGNRDFTDFDADGDGIVDLVEGRNTPDFITLTGNDSDNDGIDNVFDQSKSTYTLADTDNDGTPDYLDLDSDGDGISDAIEAYDSDTDGQMDITLSNGDYDADGLDNAVDTDSTSYINSGGSENDQEPLDFPKASSSSTEPLWRMGSSSSNLPIELTSFEATVEENNVFLKWETATELNNDYFTIERSYNGIHYEIIGELKGAGTSNASNSYDFVDSKARPGLIYYRLTQTDFDGKSETFTPINVSLKYIQKPLEIDRVFPNPFSEKFTIEFTCESSENITISLYNSYGQLVIKKEEFVQEGWNQITVQDDRGLKPGYYFCIINSSKQKSKSVKLIKTK
jgi:hypothetical protein